MTKQPLSVKAVFDRALEIAAAAERQAYLDEACAEAPELRQKVEALLQAYEDAGSFLEKPAPDLGATVGSEPSPPADEDNPAPANGEAPGTVIGPYKLLQQIGEGGMGTVFMAEQTQPVQRKVALKLIKSGMDSRQVIARFEAERQALALMDHPNIARVLDAGTSDAGRPYFVMELVKGVPITRYCDEHHLTPKERLELFVPVCQAVQHAHQKGIIHRDLKPSNVMVCLYDGKPVPKVIDFGIAKATGARLTEKTLFTELGQVVGTLEYMSPEQAELNQLDIDTRSDIYSLGVLLYELLTGTTPLERKRFQAVAFLEVLRLIREEESPKPSTRLSTDEGLPSIAANRGLEPKKLSGLVRGELDWIVMKTLEKDRNRRYETANAFAADVQRYLADEPVTACPPSTAYRLKKFLRRNKRPVLAAALVLLALVGGIVGTTWQAVRATQAARALETATTEREQQQSHVNRELAETLLQAARLRDRGKAKGPQDKDQWTRLRELSHRADALAGNELADSDLVRQVHALLADLRQEEADRRMVARLEELRSGFQGAIQGTDLRILVGDPDNPYFAAFKEYGLPVFELSVEEAARRIAASPIRDHLMGALDDLAANDVVLCRQLLPIAQRVYDSSWTRKYFEARMQLGPQQVAQLAQLARQPEALDQPPGIMENLAGYLSHVDPPAGLDFYNRMHWKHPADLRILNSRCFVSQTSEVVVGFRRAMLAVRPDSSVLHVSLAEALLSAGHDDEAIGGFRLALQLMADNARAHFGLGQALEKKGSLDEAIAAYKEAVRFRRNERDVTAFYQKLIGALERKGSPAEAITGYLPGYQQVVRRSQSDGRWVTLADVLARWGKADDAIAAYAEAIRLAPDSSYSQQRLFDFLKQSGRLDQAIAGWREALRRKPDALETCYPLCMVLEKSGRLNEAIAVWQEAVRTRPDAGANASLGDVLARAERFAEAQAAYREAIRHEPSQGSQFKARYALASILEKTGTAHEAIEAYREVIRFSPYFAKAHEQLSGLLAKTGREDEAVAAYFTVIQQSLSLPGNHLAAGQKFADSGRRDMAIVVYRALLRSKPELYEANVRLGDTLIAAGRLDEAIRLKADSSVRWTVNLCGLFERRNLLDQAIPLCRESLRHRPDDLLLHGLLALALERRGKAKEAIAAYSEWIRLQPKNGYALRNRGQLYQGLNQTTQALADYTRATEAAPDSPSAWVSRANCYLELGEWEHAVADFSKVIELEPRDMRGWAARARCLGRLSRFQEAQADYEQALKLAPPSAEGHNNLAWLLATCPELKVRNPARAVETAKKAVALAPQEGTYWNTLGVAHYRAGEWKGAAEALTKSMSLRKGGDGFDWLFLAMAHWQLGQKDEARKWYDKGVQWMEKNQSKDEDLRGFQAEAKKLMGP